MLCPSETLKLVNVRKVVELKAGVHFRARRAKDFFSTVFAWRKDYVIKKFRANKKKVERSSTFFNRYVKFDQWKCFFFRLTNDVNVEMFRALRAKVDTGLEDFWTQIMLHFPTW